MFKRLIQTLKERRMQTSLFFNQEKISNHGIKLNKLISQHDNIVLCSGWLNHEGLKILCHEIKEALARGARIQLIYSEKHVKFKSRIRKKFNTFKEACKSPDSFSYYMVPKDKTFMHTKAYLFERDNHYTLLVGSANLMDSGLEVNHELSIEHKGQVGDDMHRSICGYLSSIKNSI